MRHATNLNNYQKLDPSRILLGSLTSYFLVILVGPYSYPIFDYNAVTYFLGLMIVFWVGLKISFSNCCNTFKSTNFGKLTKVTNSYVTIMVILSIPTMLYLLYFNASNSGLFTGSNFGDARNYFDQIGREGGNRSLLIKICDLIASSAIIWPMILFSQNKIGSQKRLYLVLLAIILSMLNNLSIGSRNNAFLTLSTFIFILYKRSVLKLEKLPNPKIFKFVIYVILITATLTMLVLFYWRSGVTTSDYLVADQMRISHKSVAIRAPYAILNEKTSGLLSPMYHLAFYYTHSLSFFSLVFSEMSYESNFYGLYHLRFFLLLTESGKREFFEMIESQSVFGMYPTCAQGVLIDFGLYGSFVFILILGWVFGAVAAPQSKGNLTLSLISPLIYTIIIMSPVYPFTYGGSDIVFFAFIGNVIVLKVLNKIFEGNFSLYTSR